MLNSPSAITNIIIKSRFLRYIFMVLAVILPLSAYGQDFSAEFLEDYGYVSVIGVQGDYDADDTVPDPYLARTEITKAFYTKHSDDYDFIVIFTDFDFAMPQSEAKAFYTNVINDIQGIGIPLIDNSGLYGSNGILQGTIDMGNINNLSLDPSSTDFSVTMSILSHELLHRWASYISFIDGSGFESKALLSDDESHWSSLLDTKGSVQYGNAWQDNEDGTFTSLKGGRYFSPLDLYLMGIVSADEVPPMLLITDPSPAPEILPQEGLTISGTARYVTIQQIIAAEGSRLPSYENSPKSFKIGYVLATQAYQTNTAQLNAIATLIRNWETWFSAQTYGRAQISTRWTPVADSPTSPESSTVSGEYLAEADISAGVNWLISQQLGDGAWMDSSFTILRDTSAAVEALDLMSPGSSSHSAGSDWIDAAETENSEALALKIVIKSSSGSDVTTLVDQLIACRNNDGGWGTNPNYESNPKDTAKALLALHETGIATPAVVDPALAYLESCQNTESGGWGDLAVGSSISTSATVLDALKRFNADGSLDLTIQEAINYLTNEQNGDGSFGPGSATIYDTALVINALHDSVACKNITRPASDFLKGRQFTDGSWQDSSYQTAVALVALELGGKEADLAISNEDVTISPDPVTTLPSDVTIAATVRNLGNADAESAKVALFQEVIDASHMIEERQVDIGADSSINLNFDILVPNTETSTYYLILDPDHTLYELDEDNNSAVGVLTFDVSHFIGGEGDDVLIGDAGNDTLDGGAGNDTLDGGEGDDTYLFGQGYGNDTITYTVADIDGFDVVAIGGGITAADLGLSRSGDDLVISVSGGSDTLTISQYFIDDGGDYIVDEIRLDDGTAWTPADLAYLSATAGNDLLEGGAGDDTIDGLEGDDDIYGFDGNDTLMGSGGNDDLEGGEGDDVLYGGLGRDHLYGQGGNDVLDGGVADGEIDYLTGGDGNNTYHFGTGYGYDIIYSDGTDGNDGLLLGEGLSMSSLDFLREANDLKIAIEGTEDILKIYDYFSTGLLETIQLFDGTALGLTDVIAILQVVTEGDDTLIGYGADEELAGLGGNDIIKGMDGDDILIGGAGDDELDGGNGNDTYRYALGDGQDIIYSRDDLDEHFEVIELQDGIDPEAVVLRRYIYSTDEEDYPGFSGETGLILEFVDGGSILIRNYFYYDQYRIDEIRFANGVVWDIQTVIDKVIGVTSSGDDTFLGVVGPDTLIGAEGDDELYGRGGHDTLDGGPGNDFLAGGPDLDAYYFGPGYGSDTIDNGNYIMDGHTQLHTSENDIIIFKEGITPDDLFARRTGNNLSITFPGSDDSLLIINHFQLETYKDERVSWEISAFRFDDGTVWHREDIDALCIVPTEGDDILVAFETNDMVNGLGGDDLLSGREGNDILNGGPGADRLYGGDDNDILYGMTGDDELDGGRNDDKLYGGDGNDTLKGYLGNDQFIFAPGCGHDLIEDLDAYDSNMDMISLTGGLTFADIDVHRTSYDLILVIKTTGETLTVPGYFKLVEQPDYPGLAGKISVESGESLSITDVRTLAAEANVITEGDDELFGDLGDDTISGLGGSDLIIGEAGDDALSGGEGNDELIGGDGNDVLNGEAGIDTLEGNDGDDSLYGGTENDDLDGGDGNDILYGDAGDDTLAGMAGEDDLYGGDGNDTLDGGWDNDMLVGGPGEDALAGSVGDDSLDGGDDNDSLEGGPGNDHLIGGAGDDLLRGGDGEDVLDGGDGNDTLWAADDYSDDSGNTLSGNRGDDILYGSCGSETYHFGSGDGHDLIVESPEGCGYFDPLPDSLQFGAGIVTTDLVLIRRGNDLIIEIGGAATDGLTIQDWFQFSGPLHKIEAFHFEDATEWTVADIESRVVYYGTSGDDTLLGSNDYADHIFGEAGDDYINGYDGDDVLDGGDGNDFINGEAGDDELVGGPGNDQLTGGAGNDLLAGGEGDDRYVVGADGGFDLIDNSGGGTDWILFGDDLTADRLSYTQEGDNLVISIDDGITARVTVLGWFADPANRVDYVQPSGGTGIPADQIEQLIGGGEGDDGIEVPDEGTFDAVYNGTESNEQIQGTVGADLIRGYGGDDTLFAFDGDDWLLGGEGGDYLDGGAGDDVLYGAAGDDTYVYAPGYGHETIDNSGGGTDWLLFADTLTIEVLVFERSGDDLLIRTDSPDDTVTVLNWFLSEDNKLTYIQPAGGTGMTAAEVEALIEDSGGDTGDEGEELIPDESTFDNVVVGTDAGEQLIGSGGRDLLRGLAGDDQLFGLSGEDWLVGGEGGDYLNGGPGDDGVLGGPGDDQLGGDPGNDFLRAGSGDDIYVFSPGSGADTIDNQDGGQDWLIFTDTLTMDVLEFYQADDDLLILVVGGTDQVTVLNWFADPEVQIDYIQPAGGIGMSPAQINLILENGGEDGTTGEGEELIPDESTFDAVFNGTDADEQIVGTYGHDLVKGHDGDDQLFGLNGDDWLSGGNGADFLGGGEGDDNLLGGPGDDTMGSDAGSDFLRAGSGDDIYLYSPGGGADTIDNQDGGLDWIIFTDDLSEDRLSYLHIGNDLVIQVDQSAASQILVRDWFLGDTYQVDYVQPAGSYGIPAATITQSAVVP